MEITDRYRLAVTLATKGFSANDISHKGHAVLNAHISKLLSDGVVAYNPRPTNKKPYVLTAYGRSLGL